MTETRLERYEKRTDWPLAAVALTFLGLYSVRVLAQLRGGAAEAIEDALIALYCVFVVDYLARLWLAQPRGKWFRRHLWELPIILLPFLRPLRLLSIAMVVKTLEKAIGHTIRGRVIIYTICGAVTVVYAASLAVLEAERGQPESGINTFGDALWWAMTTVTTVGYGDLKIVTGEGRVGRGGADDRRHHVVGCSSRRRWRPGSSSASARKTRPPRRPRPRTSRSCSTRFGDSRSW